MVVKKKAKAAPKKTVKKKAAAPKKPVAKKATPKKAIKDGVDLSSLDRKGLAGKARELKKELLAIRFNIQAPSLRDYRKKRRELASVLAQLA